MNNIDFYVRASDKGIGAIILESFIPIEFGHKDIKYTRVDLVPIKSGLGRNSPSYMGFSLFGKLLPNIGSIKYGHELVKKLRKKINVPLVGSLVNLGTKKTLVESAKLLAEAGVDALELNYSCLIALPSYGNVSEKESDEPHSLALSPDIISAIKSATKLKTSIKVTPSFNFESLLQNDIIKYIDGITYANANLGLIPPTLTPPFDSPFKSESTWSSSCIYGPLERAFTYEKIVKFKKNELFHNLQFSAVGGFVHSENIVEALLLGADTVQLSSGILWNGLDFITTALEFLKTFMRENHFSNITEWRGVSLNFIKDQPFEFRPDSNTVLEEPYNKKGVMKITEKCIQCYKCANTCCLAIKKTTEGLMKVDSTMCSGCGWCQVICPINGAITRSS